MPVTDMKTVVSILNILIEKRYSVKKEILSILQEDKDAGMQYRKIKSVTNRYIETIWGIGSLHP